MARSSADEPLENGLAAEFFDFGEPLYDFPQLSPRAVPTFRRIESSINFETQDVFPGTDLLDGFYIRWKGKIKIPTNGHYTFSLRSDDGSRLFLDDQLVVDNGGVHGWAEKSGAINLSAGLHEFSAEYFEHRLLAGCQLFWESEQIVKEIIPTNAFFHEKQPTLNVERPFWFVATEKLNQYFPRVWESADGLPHNAVFAALQTRDGYVWGGTQKGLARFDGKNFTVFDSKNTPGLKGQIIRCLCQTRDNVLWIGTDEGGLSFMKDGKIFQDATMQTNNVKVFFESSDGSFWIGTTTGVMRRRDGKESWFDHHNGMAGDTVTAICEDQQGNLWFGTSMGLSRFKEKFLESFNKDNGLPTNPVRALCCDQKNRLWIGTSGGGLSRMENGKFRNFAGQDGLPDRFVTTIFEDSRHELWIGTLGGLCREAGERFAAEPNIDGVPYETVFTLTGDNEGGIWIGTKEGLTRLHFKPFRAFTKDQGLTHNNIMSVLESADGTIWLSTWGGGMSGLRKGTVMKYNARTVNAFYDLILSVCETRDGSLWFGGDFDGGLFQFKNGAFTHFGKNDGINPSPIRVIYEDSTSDLWIGTNEALYQRRDGKFRRFTRADGLAGNTIRAIHQDSSGNLWIGTTGGLSRRTNGKFFNLTTKDGLSANQVVSIYEDRDRTLWIGTDGGGLNRFANGKFTTYTTKEGLSSDNILEILEDDRGNLWMSSFSGIFHVAKNSIEQFDHGKLKSLPCASYGKEDGLSSVQCNGISKPAGWKSKDGRLWFPTTRGVVVVDPNSIRENKSPPPIFVERVVADKNKLTPENGMIIPPGKGELEFHYTALSFGAPEKSRFKFKLEGFDSDWVTADTRRVAYYNNLKPRAYTFRVIGCNNDGIWNEKGASVAFILQPYYWQTRWFLGLMIFGAVGFVAGSARYVTWRKVQAKLLRLEKQHAVEKERARIARDMHDDLGASLTQVAMLSDMALSRQGEDRETCISKTSEVSRELVRNLDAIVWSVNPNNDSLEKFALYICEYLRMFLGTGPVSYRMEMPDDLPPLPLSAEVRHNLFLIIKEALNNVVKHSRANEVWFRLRFENSRLTISIEDNGKGFSSGTVEDFGNGLRNMRKRVEHLGGEFQLQSDPEKGTRVIVTLALHQ